MINSIAPPSRAILAGSGITTGVKIWLMMTFNVAAFDNVSVISSDRENSDEGDVMTVETVFCSELAPE